MGRILIWVPNLIIKFNYVMPFSAKRFWKKENTFFAGRGEPKLVMQSSRIQLITLLRRCYSSATKNPKCFFDIQAEGEKLGVNIKDHS